MYGSSSVLHPVGHDATDSSARFIRSTYSAAMLRGEFGKLHFPLVKGRDGHLLTARWLTEQQQYMPLWSSCDILYKLQVLFQFAYPPPPPRWFLIIILLRPPAKRSTRIFPVWQCWRWHVSVTGAHSVRSRNHGVVIMEREAQLGR